jgi:hypothetical protein
MPCEDPQARCPGSDHSSCAFQPEKFIFGAHSVIKLEDTLRKFAILGASWKDGSCIESNGQSLRAERQGCR